MNKTLTCIITLLVCLTINAQPRAMGLRLGASGIEASYQHKTHSKEFLQVDFGMDLGYNVNGRPGVKAAATYNFIWAEPAWTAKGTWSLYSGPGVTLGFVDDIVPYDIEGKMMGYQDNGFAIGAHVDIGLEYTFATAPLSLGLNVRPCFGIHINDGRFKIPETDITVKYGSKTGFYDNGLLGFAPSLALRYRF